ncbi:MAG: hypothetical protein K6D94_01655, partial [Clostridiales bacterium]|nr:hypothetical protein [Clostridiales bacterium]
MSNENNGAPRNGQQTVTDADWRNQRQQGGQATVTDADWRNQRQQGGQATVTDADWRNQRQQGGQATVTDADWRNQRQQGGQATVTDANWRNQGQQGGQATVTDANWRNQGQQGGQATVADPDFRRPSQGPVTSGFDTLENFKARIAALPELTSKNGRVYRIVEPLTERGGESAVMLCQDPEGRSVVAKVFYDKGISESAMKARQKVLNYMRTPEGREYTLAVMDIGTAESDGRLYYFEITPYCRGGDISHEGAFAFDQIVGLAARLNEALQSIHNAGIIHRDIKPENLYR